MLNPYDVLGVSKTSSQDEIKKAFRHLAKKNHPDLNPGNKNAEAKFKEISHANDLIGSAEDRAKFDNGEMNDQQEYARHHNQQNRQSRQGPRNTRYSQSFEDDLGGQDFFDELFRAKKEQQTQKVDRDIQYKMSVGFKDSILGVEKIITLSNGKNLQVKIPAGISSGLKLRFKGQGIQGANVSEHGDAFIEITVDPLAGWTRIGNDLESELPISFMEGILGAEVSVQTMHGPVMLKIPPGVSTGSKLRIKGKGIQRQMESGNQIVVLKVILPKTVSPELTAAMSSWKGAFDYNPRVPLTETAYENATRGES